MQPESDGGLQYLEQKLGIFIQGPSQTRRNAALDILTGRVADDRLLAPAPNKPQPTHPAPPGASSPVPVAPTRVHPSYAYRTPRAIHATGDALAAVDWSSRSSVSPWLAPSDAQRPRIRIQRPTPPAPARGPLVRSLMLAAATISVVLVAGLGVRGYLERVAIDQPTADAITTAPAVVDTAPVVVDRAPVAVDIAPVVVDAPIVASAITDPVLAIPEPAATGIPTTTPSIAPSPAVPVPVPASVLRVIVDDNFTSNTGNWPNDPQGPGWLTGGIYRLAASQVAQFVAVGIPGAPALGDTVVTGWFHKVGGPSGGGYGLILRDQNPEVRDGRNQLGHYYVFEVGDRGEVGVWLRDGDHWVDLLSWTPSAAVKPGYATNELTVTAAGDHLSFVVNGIPVASQTDTVLHTGGAGLFVGGDSNEVAVDRIAVSSPR